MTYYMSHSVDPTLSAIVEEPLTAREIQIDSSAKGDYYADDPISQQILKARGRQRGGE